MTSNVDRADVRGAPSPASTTKILIVDDQEKNLISLEAILETTGVTIVRAKSGAEALRELLIHDFAVILLDVQMPVMDGFETARLIKSRDRTRHVPIIFLTAISTEEMHVFKGYDVGAVDYLSKPLNPDMLRSKVAVFIDLHRKNERIRRQAELLRERGEAEMVELRATSEQRYRSLADSMPHIVWSADPSGTLTYANRRWIESAEPAARGAKSLDWAHLLSDDDLTRFLDDWSVVVSRRVAWEAEYRLGRGPGVTPRWHIVRALPLHRPTAGDAPGEFIGWVGTSTDIDDRHHLEDAMRFLADVSAKLAETRDPVASMTDVAKLAVLSVADFCAIDLQEEGSSIRRITAARATDAVVSERVMSAEEACAGGLLRVITSRRTERTNGLADAAVSMTVRDDAALREGGPPLTACVSVPLLARGEVLGAMTFASTRPMGPAEQSLFEDVARRTALALESARLFALAEQRAAMLERADRAKDDFLAVLSHELRTPLNAVLGWTKLLHGSISDATVIARGLEKIERNARMQAQLIEDLLDVSRIISGKLLLERRTVDLASIVRAAIETVQETADKRGVVLETDIAEHVDVCADPSRLQQVMWNLLSNAIKFTPQGGVVRCSVHVDGATARLVVSDSGEGIEPTLLPSVFERFFQTESGAARLHGGLGLGLAIVQHLVKLHAGTVEADSAGRGKGSTFTVTIPISTEATRAPAEAPEVHVTTTPESLTGLRVLIVEDQDDAREFLRELLERYGAVVDVAAAVPEAMEALGGSEHDVLLSDLGLPGEDGYALIERVRATRQMREVFAIAVTAFASSGDRERALSSGFDAHVPKPIELPMLLSLLDGVRRGHAGTARYRLAAAMRAGSPEQSSDQLGETALSDRRSRSARGTVK